MSDDVSDFFNRTYTPPTPPTSIKNFSQPPPNQNPLDTVIQPAPPGTSDPKLPPAVQETIIKFESLVLRTLSIILILHGFFYIYEGAVQIFYVFPYLPLIYQLHNYSYTIYETVYRQSAVITSKAIVETLYGTLLIARHHKLYHRFHIFSAILILIVSFYFLKDLPSLDPEDYPPLPTPPTVKHLLETTDNHQRLQLFRNIRFQPVPVSPSSTDSSTPALNLH